MKKTFKNVVVWFLATEAEVALNRFKPKIVAVTGNVGKTSTKDAIHAVLSRTYGADRVRKSQKSFNSEFGVPLTILGLETAWSSPKGWLKNILDGFKVALFSKDFPEWLVLEVGADHPGDIERVTRWLRPDIAVLTRMSDVPVHVEYFKDAAEVLREKMHLARALKPGGTLVVNADDPHFAEPVRELGSGADAKPIKKLFYGTTKGSSVEITESEVIYDGAALPLPTGQYAVLRIADADDRRTEQKIELSGVLGHHLMYPVAAAATVALALGIENGVAAAFAHFESPKGRMHILRGVAGSAIIDDTYNSSPLACAEALRALGELSIKGRKVAALADMKELGDNAIRAHREIGKRAAESLHTLVTVGAMAREIACGAREAGMAGDRVYSFDTSEEAGALLRDLVRAGDSILIKGSQSMRMERAVKAVLAEPGRAADLLVRQEDEWLER